MEPPSLLLVQLSIIEDFQNVFKPFTPYILISIISTFLLLFISALISAAETAYFSLGPAELEEIKSSDSRSDLKVTELLSKQKKLLATLLIALNFVNIGIVILSDNFFQENESLLGFIIQVVLVTFLILLFAEVVPKIYATRYPLRTARVLAYFVYVLEKLFYPVSAILMYSTNIIDKKVKQKAHNISVDELSHALELTTDENIQKEDKKILKGILKFGNIDVKQIMKPRIDVIAFEYEINYSELLKNILNSGFSRVPVYKETLDKVAGVLYVKDLLPYLNKDSSFRWQSLLRPSFFVPENKKIDDLLREFQLKKIHLAIVVDEYGGTSGIVTLEDVIEEITGEINDEFDDDDIIYSKLDNDNYVFEGKIQLNDLCRITEIDLTLFEEIKATSDTLAGLLIELAGRIPQKNEKINLNNLTFQIEAADSRKIKRIKLHINRNITEEQV